MDGISHWEIDLENEDKILAIETEAVKPEEVINKLAGVGFEAEFCTDNTVPNKT